MNRAEIVRKITINLFYILGLSVNTKTKLVINQDTMLPLNISGCNVSIEPVHVYNTITMDIFNFILINNLFLFFLNYILPEDYGFGYISTHIHDNRVILVHPRGIIRSEQYNNISLGYLQIMFDISKSDITKEVLKSIDN